MRCYVVILFLILWFSESFFFLKKIRSFYVTSDQSDIHYIPHIDLKLTVTLPPILLSARIVGECHYAWPSLNFLNVCWHMILPLHEKIMYLL